LARPEGGYGMSEKAMTIKTMPQGDLLTSGHGACVGCGLSTAVNNVLRILGPDTVVYAPACCFLVFTAMYPTSALKLPFIYSAFENTGAVISGLSAGFRRQGKKVNVVGFAGDGGTFDIGLQAVTGAAERNDDVIYVCVDNEAYMNTGTQRSGSTPFGAWTTTTPVGKKVQGKREHKKDMMAAIMAQDVPYAATLSIAHMNDFVRKVEKAKSMEGFRFLHIMTPCNSGWKTEPSATYDLARLAVETGMWTLYEIENGEKRITYRPKEMMPVENYLRLQGRFKHMSKEDVEILQKWLCKKWNKSYNVGMVSEPVREKELAYEGEQGEGI
ncbi:MAG TPA: thiamine pyrophosphate-dependent enzyme, partial [Methanomassiliicoccales archaeon]|nr:thiamine pyrophosphate-dependent enzyme [Methanomassiliicoccales archaeon]